MPGWPLTPLVFLAMLLAMLVLLAAGSPVPAALGTAVVAAGVPVYRLVAAGRGDVRPRAAVSPVEEA